MFDRLKIRLRALLRAGKVEHELDEELRYHLDEMIDQNVRAGMGYDRARAEALKSFGGVEQAKDYCRDARGVRLVDETVRDVRFSLRTLRKSPAFTFVAVVSLMLGIGANTAIFQLLDAVRLRLLPVESPTELVEVRIVNADSRSGHFEGWRPALTNVLWEELRAHQQSFSGVFAFGDAGFNLAESGEMRNARGLMVSGEFFDVLGIKPARGRMLDLADDRRGANVQVAVISHAFWQREYGGDPSVVGRTLRLDGHPFEVVGVAPAGFFGVEPGRSFDVAVPIAAEPVFYGEDSRLDNRASWWLKAIGRLAPGSTPEYATEQLGAISPGAFEATLPAEYDAEDATNYRAMKLGATPAASGVSELREDYATSLWLLLALAGLVLLIACANLANLLPARASAQEREMAVRLALGASRGRLVRQLLTESLLISAAGALLGLFMARFLSKALVSFLDTQGSPLFVDLGLDWRVYGFTAGLAVATCVVFGIVPALRATATTPGAAMKASGRGNTEGRERLGLRRALVASQVALSLVLVTGSLLFARTLGNLLAIDPGFHLAGIAIANVDLTPLRLPEEQRALFKQRLVDRIGRVPGVVSASDTAIVPLSGGGWNGTIVMEGADPNGKSLSFFNRVGPDYFETLGIPLLGGRAFDERDTLQSPTVAIVNEEFARQFAGGANPVGMRYSVQQSALEPPTVYEIVGLVKNAKYRSLRREMPPTAYVPMAQERDPGQYESILIRSELPPNTLLPSVRQALAEENPDLVFQCEVFETQVWSTLTQERLMAALSGFFGVLALVLATVGLYGVTSYMVARRTHEIGIRMALGAARRKIAGMVVREVAILLGAGVVVGAVVAFFAARAAGAMLFGIEPQDPITLAAAVGILAAVAAVSSLVPAYRAASVDPMRALRDE